MEGFKLFVQSASFFLFIILAVLMIVAYSRIFFLNTKINRLKRRYDRLLRGKGEMDIEALIRSHGEELDEYRKKLDDSVRSQREMSSKVQFSLQKLGYVHYDAFPDSNNELSYTLVILDSFNNGIMITSLYGREQSTAFAKYIRDGKTKIKISDEEKKALDMAINGEFPIQ